MAKEKKTKEKKEKKKFKISPKKMALFSMIVTLVSFLYKIGMGIMAFSIILMVASISTFLVFVCKLVFFRRMTSDSEKKKFGYLIMMICALSFGVVFLLFAVLHVGGIDIHHENKFTGWLGYLFIGFVIIIFVLSVINLKGALEKNDLMVIGLKEMVFVSALADAVIIEEFLYKVILKYLDLPFLPVIKYTNDYFPIITAVVMLLVPLFMFRRYYRYCKAEKIQEKEETK